MNAASFEISIFNKPLAVRPQRISKEKTDKVQHWRGIPGKKPPNTAPMLDFVFSWDSSGVAQQRKVVA
jgi:hypothetical protein